MNIINREVMTMSSIEIADFASKEHKHVIRDIRTMISQLGDDPDLDHVSEEMDARGYTKQIHLPKSLSICLVAGYDAKYRMKIIRRWEELEEAVKQPALLPNQVAIDKDQLIWLQGEVIERLKNQHKAEKKLKETYKAKLDKPKHVDSDIPDHSLLCAIVNYVRCNGRMPKVDIVNDRKNYRFDGRKIPLKDDASKAVDYLVETGGLIKSDRNTLDTPRLNGGDVF
ncbi:MAG: Rha family transcriptional regulator [Aeromonadaceae bacterium]